MKGSIILFGLISAAYFALKIYYAVLAQSFMNQLDTCFAPATPASVEYDSWVYGATPATPAPTTTTTTTTPIDLVIENFVWVYIAIFKNMAYVTRNLAIVCAVFTGVIAFYHQKKNKRLRRLLDKIKRQQEIPINLRYFDRVTKPMLIIAIGAFSVIFEAYTLGSVTSTHYNTMLKQINAADMKLNDGHKCVDTDKMDLAYKVTWASICLYVFMTVFGHWMGLINAYHAEKHATANGSELGSVKTTFNESEEHEEDCC